MAGCGRRRGGFASECAATYSCPCDPVPLLQASAARRHVDRGEWQAHLLPILRLLLVLLPIVWMLLLGPVGCGLLLHLSSSSHGCRPLVLRLEVFANRIATSAVRSVQRAAGNARSPSLAVHGGAWRHADLFCRCLMWLRRETRAHANASCVSCRNHSSAGCWSAHSEPVAVTGREGNLRRLAWDSEQGCIGVVLPGLRCACHRCLHTAAMRLAPPYVGAESELAPIR